MAIMKNVKKTLIECYRCENTYTVSKLDIFFACTKCNKYIRYLCDICGKRINCTLVDYDECDACNKIMCSECSEVNFDYEESDNICSNCNNRNYHSFNS